MSRIAIGINENVLITKAHINEKKQLEIELSPLNAEAKSVFDQMLTAGVTSEGSSSLSLRILGPLLPKVADRNGNTKTIESRMQMAIDDITRFRNQLTQILEQFLLGEQIDLSQMEVQFAGTGITDDQSLRDRLLDQSVLDKIYDNLTTRFCELMAPLVGNHEPLRFKLIRQSKDKHFATIPSRFIKDRPFVELMSVPAEQSRVKFTEYEIKEGLNDGTPISSSQAEEKVGSSVPEVNPFAQPV